MNIRALKYLSVFGQFLTVFPFVVLFEAVSVSEYVWWHYIVFFAVLAVFYVCGRLCSNWAKSGRHSREFRPKAIFLSKTAITVPTAAFVILAEVLHLSSGVYIYILPAALIMYHGGYSSAYRDYSEIFGRGWFALYFVAAIVSAIIISFTRDEAVIGGGSFQLCLAFGLLIIIAAVLTNQTNIDLCTHRRDNGKTVLPKGLRAYNGGLTAAVVAVIVALCLCVPFLTQLLMFAVKSVIGFILYLFTLGGNQGAVDNMISDTGSGGGVAVDINDNSFASMVSVLLGTGIIVLIILFRRPLWEFIKGIFAPLFRLSEEQTDIAYSDEVTELAGISKGGRSRRKIRQALYREYCKETEAAQKYRLGYRLILMYLADTRFPPIPSDNTDIHRVKGERGFDTDKAERIVSVYNDVRYNERKPTDEELRFEAGFIEEIRR